MMNKRILSIFIVKIGLILSYEALSAELQLSLISNYEFNTKPLTTDLALKLDPHLMNPHRQRWVLSQTVELKGLKPLHLKGKYRVTAESIISNSIGYIRPSGPWYRPWAEFTCDKHPNSWFANEEGAKFALSKAEGVWNQILRNNLLQLSIALKQVSASTADTVLKTAQNVFDLWVTQIEKQWRMKVYSEAREEEWRYYLSEAKAASLCKKPAVKITPPLWSEMMEPVSGQPPQINQILARAPARLWNGLYTIRIDIKVAGKTLNGRFLIDSGANYSMISPTWLEGQGIYRAWVENPKKNLQPITLSSSWPNIGRLARIANVDGIIVAGYPIPLSEFLLVETEFFSPPENAGYCCDGVLGSDFLRLSPIEFQTHLPFEVRLWPKENFHLSKDSPWIELSENLDHSLSSVCNITNNSIKNQIKGIVWLTGSEQGLDIHSPWQSLIKNQKNSVWDVTCSSLQLAQGVYSSSLDASETYHHEKYPGASIGMPLLFRGNFTFDVPHGRFWFSKEALKQPRPRTNQTGLSLHYTLSKDGERILKVKSIVRNSIASSLEKEGLKPGSQITQFDELEPQDIDLWEVEQRLAGFYGEYVSLQWRTQHGLKMAPLRVSNFR